MKKVLTLSVTFIVSMFVGAVSIFAASSCDPSVKITKDGTFSPIGSVYANRKKDGEAYLFGIGAEGGDKLFGNIYTTDEGDYAYCLQAGNGFKEGTYCEDSSFDISECSSSNDGNYECGLAYILLKSVENELSYGVTQTALRLWAAKSGMGSVDKSGPVSFYDTTASRVLSDSDYAQNGTQCQGASLPGIICTGVSEEYIQALQIVAETEEGQLLNGEEVKGEPQIITDIIDNTTDDVSASVPNDVDPEDVTIKVKDNNGKDYAGDTDCVKKGDKQICRAPIEEEICGEDVKPGTSMKIILEIENYKSSGNVKRYVHSSGSSDLQVLMVIEAEREGGSSAHTETTFTKETRVPLSCDECEIESGMCPLTEMEAIVELPEACAGYDSYNEGYKKDPYMNCILNTCTSAKNYFRQYDYEPDNGTTCKIYCREDITFYLANKKKVYAGMQFKYKIQVPLLKDGKIENVLNQTDDLSSIVLQKRECTSEIDFAGWIKKYTAKVKELVTAWNNWKKYEVLLFKTQGDLDGSNYNSNMTTYTYCKLSGQQGGCKNTSTKQKSFGPSPYNSTHEFCDKTCKPFNRSNVKLVSKVTNGPGGSCSGSISPTNDGSITGPYLIYGWPIDGTTEKYNRQNLDYKKTDSKENGKFDVKNPTPTITSENDGTKPTSDSMSGGSCNLSCSSSFAYSKPIYFDKKLIGYDNYYNYNCTDYCSECLVSQGVEGADGNRNKVKEAYEKYKTEYETLKKELAKMIFNIQSCNFYGAGDEDIKESVYGSATGKIAKQLILADSACEDETCVDLLIDYEDKNYGDTVDVGKLTGVATTEEMKRNKYCSGKECYKYTPNTEFISTDTSTKTQTINVLKCEEKKRNGKCTGPTFTVPKNTHVTFTTMTEVDFWQAQEYSTQAYTGRVEVKKNASTSNSSQSLGSNVYPVSLDSSSGGKTGEYDIVQHFSDIGQGKYKIDNYDFTCQYEVYNTTTGYDCSKDDANCWDECYSIEGTVPDIKCLDWFDQTETKSYGFVYRNIDLNNMFPSSDRGIGTNWSSEQELIQKIQSESNEIFDSSHLEYKFVLTTDDINRIRIEYNDKKSTSGYLNNTLVNCKPGDDGLGFYNCKSTFFMEANITNVK